MSPSLALALLFISSLSRADCPNSRRADCVHATTDVTPRSRRNDPDLFATGILLDVVGGLALNVGFGMILAGSGDLSIYRKDSAFGGSTPPNTSLEVAGTITMIGGAAAVAGGIGLMVIGGKHVPEQATLIVKSLPVQGGSGVSVGLSF